MNFSEWLNESEGLDRVYVDHPLWGRETVGEFLKRHRIPIAPDGTFVLYHGRPKTSRHAELRPGTYVTHDYEDAKYFAARDRGLDKEKDVEVLTLRLTPDEIDPGIHITLRVPKRVAS